MAAVPGRLGMLYANMTSSGAAVPIAFINSWDANFATDKYPITSFGDTNKKYMAGLPDASGNFAGFYDAATPQMYTAAVDGVARNMYFYPSTLATGQYWFGTVLFDFNVSFPMDGPATITGTWSAATTVAKVG